MVGVGPRRCPADTPPAPPPRVPRPGRGSPPAPALAGSARRRPSTSGGTGAGISGRRLSRARRDRGGRHGHAERMWVAGAGAGAANSAGAAGAGWVSAGCWGAHRWSEAAGRLGPCDEASTHVLFLLHCYHSDAKCDVRYRVTPPGPEPGPNVGAANSTCSKLIFSSAWCTLLGGVHGHLRTGHHVLQSLGRG